MSAIRLARASTETRRHPQVRRLLSRTRRLVSRARRLGRRDARTCRIRPACRDALAVADASSRRSTISVRSRRCCARIRSRRSSSSRWSATAASSRPIPRSCPGCARSPTATARCSIFDEVMTGFRIAFGGARERFGVTAGSDDARQGDRRRASRGGVRRAARPDGADRAVGRRVSGGNALRQSAGDGGGHRDAASAHARAARSIATRTARLVQGLRAIAARHGVPFTADCAGSMWGFFFRAEPVRSFADAKTSDVERFKRFFHAALDRGVYLAPSAFEAAFMSSAHDDADIEETLERLDDAMREAWRARAVLGTRRSTCYRCVVADHRATGSELVIRSPSRGSPPGDTAAPAVRGAPPAPPAVAAMTLPRRVPVATYSRRDAGDTTIRVLLAVRPARRAFRRPAVWCSPTATARSSRAAIATRRGASSDGPSSACGAAGRRADGVEWTCR